MYPNPRNRGYEADQYEKENEEKMGVLHNRISNLKNITIAIGDEVRDQNRALDLMQGGFGDTDNLIGSTMKKMQGMYNSHGSMSIVYLSLFCVACFLVVYGLTKMGA
mmetsp:Transcript_28102/g.41320  ORF Transcript_28102/g.41320 Transcript_28102/m.41320 type:complete len:107 (+) Transcript_28102:148-468(+)|eukprot:CAMPEP_0179448536 /NCGR_PEP_ID=MMETSP0799-20121207/32353_1 /TAXON_ID=46947 /ORGANISM="Geminigera cryophila, Strain CCMP2564" /LENGTH=106 /DNA_ID=CAMNT_0021240419 /DNA_START=148 /DNA_END=468 /DNA_ORIENTATION=+